MGKMRGLKERGDTASCLARRLTIMLGQFTVDAVEVMLFHLVDQVEALCLNALVRRLRVEPKNQLCNTWGTAGRGNVASRFSMCFHEAVGHTDCDIWQLPSRAFKDSQQIVAARRKRRRVEVAADQIHELVEFFVTQMAETLRCLLANLSILIAK